MKILKEIAYSVVLVLYVAGISFATGRDYCEVHSEAEPKLCTYEPTTIGYTHDSDDTGFMDFKISVRYQLFPAWITRGQNYLQSGLGDNSALYFAFTGRFSQYIGTRDSSPVVEKLFNPKLFYRLWTDPAHEDHVDLAFAHESNGQAIDSQAEYQAALATSANQNEVKDQLSRGWDYWEISWKKTVYERPAYQGLDREKSLKTSIVSYLG
ncbi:MAG: phospholipase A, partial [Nitrospirota bacterium]